MSVVNVRVSNIRPDYDNLKEWMQDPNNVYIGRGRIVFIDGQRFPITDSVWANPYRIGQDGTRADVLRKYKKYIQQRLQEDLNLEELRNKTLGCWCAPDPCHGDILLKLLK